MKKLLTDRLNELKSKVAVLRYPKLTKILDLEKIAELNIRIDEVYKLIQKAEMKSKTIKSSLK